MSIEKRGSSFRARIHDRFGKPIMTRTFATRAEAKQWHDIEKGRLSKTAQAEAKREEIRRILREAAQSENPGFPVPHGLGVRLWQGWVSRPDGTSYQLPEAEIRRVKEAAGIFDWEPLASKPAAEPDPVSNITMGEVLRRYRAEVTPEHRGHAQEDNVIGRMLEHRLCKRLVTDLSRMDFNRYRDTRRKQVGPDTVNRELHYWAISIDHARDQGWIKLAENPARVKRISHDNSRDRRLNPGEEEKLLEHASPILRDAVIVLVDTAMRRGELLKLTPELAHPTFLKLPKEITKTLKAREVPLITERAREVIARRAKAIKKGRRLFPIKGSALSQQFLSACRKAGIEGLRLHDLRHEGTSRLCETRKYIGQEVMAVTGHRSWSHFQRYLNPRGDELASRMIKGSPD